MGRLRQKFRILRRGADGASSRREDAVAVEEPLEIRLSNAPGSEQNLSVTMRTPGNDFDLVAGFLLSEGIVSAADELVSLRFCAGEDEHGRQTYNVVQARLRPDVPMPDFSRNVYTTSSCGICGTASIEAVKKQSRYKLNQEERLDIATALRLPEILREHQSLFDDTGGVHAAGLFSKEGQLLCLREDVGRHNAVDKVFGWALRERRLPLSSTILQVSGRASFELVQKAAMAGVPVLCAVSAPSSLAVELARESGMILCGFSRGSSINVYSGVQRVE